MDCEEWRDVPGQEGRFQVSSLGRVRSLTRSVTYKDGRVAKFNGRSLSDSRGLDGYRKIDFGRGHRRVLLHQAVAAAFLGEMPQWAECINHIDGDKRNNAAGNLEWTTYAENNRHARETGLQSQHGEACNLTKYSDQLVAAMRRVHEKYGTAYRDLADIFDVSETLASQVVRGKTRAR